MVSPKQAAYRQRGMSEQSHKIIDEYNAGKTQAELAREFKLNTKTVYGILERARERGMNMRPRRKETPKERRCRLLNGRQLGLMSEMFDMLEEPVLQWLVRQLPAGVSLAEYVAVLVRDTYCDEMEPSETFPIIPSTATPG